MLQATNENPCPAGLRKKLMSDKDMDFQLNTELTAQVLSFYYHN